MVAAWPAIPANRRPNLDAGLRSAPATKVTPRITADLHWHINAFCAVYASALDIPELSPSSASEWLLRIGLSHIDDPDLFRLIHPAGNYHPSQLQIPDGAPPAGGEPVEGWDANLGGPVKALGVKWPEGLIDHIALVMRDWKAAHPQTLAAFGGRGVARQGFIEGLLRLGMKHAADPDATRLLRSL